MSEPVMSMRNGRGFQVSAERLDGVDLAALQFVEDCMQRSGRCRVLDVGCGLGHVSARFAAVGAEVVAVDIEDYARSIRDCLDALNVNPSRVEFVQQDIRTFLQGVGTNPGPGRFNVVYSQRFLHYLEHDQALKLLSALKASAEKDAGMFVSLSGLRSPLGAGYSVGREPLHLRFGLLSESMQQLMDIDKPVCLYTLKEAIHLLADTGWELRKAWESDFGNLKLIARREVTREKQP